MEISPVSLVPLSRTVICAPGANSPVPGSSTVQRRVLPSCSNTVTVISGGVAFLAAAARTMDIGALVSPL